MDTAPKQRRGKYIFKYYARACVKRYFQDDVGRESAALAYYLLFSMFPLMIFFSMLLGYAHLNQSPLIEGLYDFLPMEVAGMIADYLDRALPADWDALDAFQRREAVRPGGLGATGTLRRDRVCLAEIWCECFGRMKGDMKRGDSVELGRLMRKVKGWEPAKKAERFGPYGVQKGYVRTAAKGPGKGTEGGWS